MARKKGPCCRKKHRGPVKARSTWPTGYLKRHESQAWLSKPGHYKTGAAYLSSAGSSEGGPTCAIEDSEYGARAELLFFQDGKVRLMAVPYPSSVEVDEEGVANGATWARGPLVQGLMGVSRFGRCILTPLQQGSICCLTNEEGYDLPHPLKLELRVLQPGQVFKVEQCPHEVAQCPPPRDDVDGDGMMTVTTGPGDLVVTFKFPGRRPVVNYMKRVHETPTNWRGLPVNDDAYEGIDLEQRWFT